MGDIGTTIGLAIQTALSALGLVSGLGMILVLLTSYQPLMSMISGFTKMLSFTLKPIGDVIMTLLYPILLLLKPLTIAVKMVMLPFVQLALEAMKQGAEAIQSGDMAEGIKMILLGSFDILSGLGLAIATLSTGLIKTVFDLAMGFLNQIVQLIFPNMGEKFTELSNIVTDMIGVLMGSFAQNGLETIANINEAAGIDTTDFVKDTQESLGAFFGTDGDFTGNFMKDLTELTDELKRFLSINDFGFRTIFDLGVSSMQKAGIRKVKSLVNRYKEELNVWIQDQKTARGGTTEVEAETI